MKKCQILILGGTGAMGVPLVDILSEQGCKITVTTRQQRTASVCNVDYVQGDAHEYSFILSLLLKQKYDVIIDFMVYDEQEFEERVFDFLKNTKQYIYFSSCRVYADSSKPITESTPRILDTCTDPQYICTGEYALTKARQENILLNSKNKNWTIIRPYITYADERLQFGSYEKEQWLQRAIYGRTVLFSKEMAEKKTTMTLGEDVAKCIADLIENEKAMGEVIQITAAETLTWKEIWNIYAGSIQKITGRKPKIKYIDDTTVIEKILKNNYQVKYDRMYNRVFDSKKVSTILKDSRQFCSIERGLDRCVQNFIDCGYTFKKKSWELDAYMDKIAGERTPLRLIPTLKEKLKYVVARYTPYFSVFRKK